MNAVTTANPEAPDGVQAATAARAMIRERHRQRAFVAIAGALIVVQLPFTLNHFVQGRVELGLAWGAVILLLAIEGVPLLRGRRPPLPLATIFIPLLPALGLAIVTRGYIGVLWTYPMLLLLHFALPRTAANLLNIALTAVTALLAHVYIGAEATPRVLASFAMTIFAVNVFLSIQDDLQRDLDHQAQVDAITGAFNRGYLDRCFAELLELRQRHAIPLSLLMIGIDDFRRFNRRFGHLAGDEALRCLATTMGLLIRSTDRLFRYGDAEFVILLPYANSAEALPVAAKLRTEAAAECSLHDRNITLSIGIATLRDAEDWDAVAARCDAALGRARQGGGDRVEAAD